jgi:hypothetical protein
MVTSLLEQVKNTTDSPILAATAVVTSMPLCHWGGSGSYNARNVEVISLKAVKRLAPDLLASLLHNHLHSEGAALSPAVIYALAGSSAHYLLGLFPREESNRSQSMLPIHLAQIFLACDDNETQLKRTIAVVLASAAFAIDFYPGGEVSSHDVETREFRAVQVLQHYRANKPEGLRTTTLFTFGFVGLLHRLNFSLLDQDTTIAKGFALVNEASHRFHKKLFDADIHGLPPSFTLQQHAIQAVSRCLLSTLRYPDSHNAQRTIASLCSERLIPQFGLEMANASLYTAALDALCHAQSEELQACCIRILDAQPIPFYSPDLIQNLKDQSLLDKLFHASVANNPHVAPIAALHLGLIIAVIVSSLGISLDARQSALQPLVDLEECTGLQPSVANLSLPSMTQMYAHLEQARSTGPSLEMNLRTMQFVVNFCHADPTARPSSPVQPVSDINIQTWHEKLQELKDSFKSVPRPIEQTENPNEAGVASPCWPDQGQESEISLQAAASLETV